MMVEQRKELLFQQLDLSCLDKWSDRNQAAAQALLAEYHNIFCLEPGELGSMDLAKHEIRVVDDEPSKERFWRIPPPMVDEVHAYMKEMLEVSAICPRHLCIVFDHFQKHNLRLKPTKCEFFWDEINYLAHHVSKEGVQPSKEYLKAVAEFATSKTYMKIQAFLGMVGHYRQFIKGFACIVQPLHRHLLGEGAHKKSKQVTLTMEV